MKFVNVVVRDVKIKEDEKLHNPKIVVIKIGKLIKNGNETLFLFMFSPHHPDILKLQSNYHHWILVLWFLSFSTLID